ncbi:hypothetical protein GGR51DRAFT_566976 [Nemania sp. FL0031]|nr:hypothetical protein GGR51DRAFT_566976 [Nemania sp. FL0031]
MSEPVLTRPGSSDSKAAQGTSENEVSKTTPSIDDSNQYEEFDLEEIQSGTSFAVSEKSKESKRYAEDKGKIVMYLETEGIECSSVECVGRVSEDKKIRTTVVIGFSKVPSSEIQQRIRKDLGSRMTPPVLPVEFVDGGLVEE